MVHLPFARGKTIAGGAGAGQSLGEFDKLGIRLRGHWIASCGGRVAGSTVVRWMNSSTAPAGT